MRQIIARLWTTAFVLIMATAAACASGEEVGRREGEVAVITVNVDSLKRWMASKFDAGTVISTVTIETHGDVHELIGIGSNGTSSRVIAVGLTLLPTGRWVTGPVTTTNMCSGAGCEKCGFVRSDNGNIKGCDCAGVGTLCNHTVSQSSES